MLLVWNDEEARFYIFDNVQKKYLSTNDYGIFLRELKQLPDGSTVIYVRKCCAPFVLKKNPIKEMSLFWEIVRKKKFTINPAKEQLFMICTCESRGLKFIDNYRWGYGK